MCPIIRNKSIFSPLLWLEEITEEIIGLANHNQWNCNQ